MPLTHVDRIAKTYALASGDNVVQTVVAAEGASSRARRITIRSETAGPISVAVKATAMAAANEGAQLGSKESVSFENINLGTLRIFTGDANQRAWISIESDL
jgi:hypothetical protein